MIHHGSFLAYENETQHHMSELLLRPT